MGVLGGEEGLGFGWGCGVCVGLGSNTRRGGLATVVDHVCGGRGV